MRSLDQESAHVHHEPVENRDNLRLVWFAYEDLHRLGLYWNTTLELKPAVRLSHCGSWADNCHVNMDVPVVCVRMTLIPWMGRRNG